MGKKVIIAEKPSVGREYASALKVKGKKDGYIENDQWIVTWSFGHLVQLSMPEDYDPALKKWTLETLPFLPEKYHYKVISDVKKQFQTIKTIYNRSDIDEIYYAGDSGREGLYIQMLIRMLAGHNPKAKEKVVWIDSQTEDEILRGVREAKDISAYKDMSDSGFVRAEEDFSTGINYSRALSVKYGMMLNHAAKNKKYYPISVGRVMTCVLGMVVEREREVANFKPTTFYKVISEIDVDGLPLLAEWKPEEGNKLWNSAKLYNNSGFLKEADAEAFISELPNRLTVKNIKKSEEKKYAPLLFNLAELQSECTKRFHISPADTLSVAQTLYEKKATTYPRTDARVLTTAIAGELNRNLSGLANSYGEYVSEIRVNKWSVPKRYVDDSKVTDHYAIIPTGEKPDGLSEIEAKVYDLIVRRFLSIYYPPAIYDKVSLEERAGEELFVGKAKEIKELGFFKVAGVPNDSKNKNAGAYLRVKEGEYRATYQSKQGETKPPSRYTTGSMILAMENAGKLIEDEELREQIKGCGIGTSATRAETIEKLLRLGYIEVNKKTQILYPRDFGVLIYETVKLTIPSLLSPEMTAEWEKQLTEVAQGRRDRAEYEKEIFTDVRKQTNSVINNDISQQLKERAMAVSGVDLDKAMKRFTPEDTGLICPFCGEKIFTSKYGVRCENNRKKECVFSIGEISGKAIPIDQIKKLVEDKKTDLISGFISKSKRKYDAYLVLNMEAKKIEFEFPERKEKKSEFCCPDCNKPLVEWPYSLNCECGMRIPRVMAKKKLSSSDIEALIKKGKTDLISGFTSKKGKKFKAYIVRDGKETRFEFPERKK